LKELIKKFMTSESKKFAIDRSMDAKPGDIEVEGVVELNSKEIEEWESIPQQELPAEKIQELKDLLFKLARFDIANRRSFSKKDREELSDAELTPAQHEIQAFGLSLYTKYRHENGYKYKFDDYQTYHILTGSGNVGGEMKFPRTDFYGSDSVVDFIEGLADKYLSKEEGEAAVA